MPAASGILGAVLTQGAMLWRDHWVARKDRKYWALRLALVFERFAIACAYQREDASLFVQSKGAVGSPHVELPALGDLPVEADWKGLDHELVAMVLNFPLELEVMKHGARSLWEVVDEDVVAKHCDEQAGEKGLQAIRIADALRKHYRLAQVGLSLEWDFRESLQNERAA